MIPPLPPEDLDQLDRIIDILKDPKAVKKYIADIKEAQDALTKAQSVHDHAVSEASTLVAQVAKDDAALKRAKAEFETYSKRKDEEIRGTSEQIIKIQEGLRQRELDLSAGEKELKNARREIAERLDALADKEKQIAIVQAQAAASKAEIEARAKRIKEALV